MNERSVFHLDDLFTAESHAQQFLNDIQGRCVIANGCFDVLHPGHLRIFQKLGSLAALGNIQAVVALNSDSSVSGLNGPRRPIIPHASRAELIRSLRWPISVVIFDEMTPQRVMDLLRPLTVVKGSEYSTESVIRWKDSEVVSVEMLPYWSTSSIVKGSG